MSKFIKLTNQSGNQKILLNTSHVVYFSGHDNGTHVFLNTLLEIPNKIEKDYEHFSISVSQSLSEIEGMLSPENEDE